MGTKRARQKQEELFYASERAEAPGHPFYQRLNAVLNEAGFDAFCEERCHAFYHRKLGRPSLAPGVYFHRNRSGLCKAFGITQSHMSYARYWSEIIERVRDAVWWNAPRPSDIEQKEIWMGRTAFLDALYYEE